MTNEQATEFVNKINEALEIAGIADRYRISWNDELSNEAIVEGTITDIDATDEFDLGVRFCKGGMYLAICAGKSARQYLRHEAHVGDFIKVRTYLKPAMFKGEHCYLHIDDEANILEHFHKTGVD